MTRGLLRPLTEREKEICQLLLQAQSDKEIACRLDISTRTARFHVSNILKKFGVARRVELLVHGRFSSS